MSELPDYIDAEAWAGFASMRKSLKKPLTPRAEKLVLKELKRIKDAGHCPNDSLDQSTLKCWLDVWPVRHKDIHRTPEAEQAAHEEVRKAERVMVTAPTAEQRALMDAVRSGIRRVA